MGRQLYPKLDLVSSAKPVMEEWRMEQLSITNTFKKIHKDLPEIKKTIESIPPLMRKILEEENKHDMPQVDITYFVRQLYMGIIGVGFLIVENGIARVQSIGCIFNYLHRSRHSANI